MSIVQHVWQKSQSKGSARCLLLSIAIHSNACCGVAWPSDTTLRHEVNVSRQRIHELKNQLEDAGELVIVERPGTTNLYFVTWQGKPLGGLGEYRAAPGSTHEPGCPLRRGMLTPQGEVSGSPDTHPSGISDTSCQADLTQKTTENDVENETVSLSEENGPSRPPEMPAQPLSPARLKRLGLSPGSRAWDAYASLSIPCSSDSSDNTSDKSRCCATRISSTQAFDSPQASSQHIRFSADFI
jgi:hypothetical protein